MTLFIIKVIGCIKKNKSIEKMQKDGWTAIIFIVMGQALIVVLLWKRTHSKLDSIYKCVHVVFYWAESSVWRVL